MIRVATLGRDRKRLLKSAFNNEDMPRTLIRVKTGRGGRFWVSRAKGGCLEFLWWDPGHWVTPA